MWSPSREFGLGAFSRWLQPRFQSMRHGRPFFGVPAVSWGPSVHILKSPCPLFRIPARWTRSPFKTLNPGVWFFGVPAVSGGPSSPHFRIPESTFSNPRPLDPVPVQNPKPSRLVFWRPCGFRGTLESTFWNPQVHFSESPPGWAPSPCPLFRIPARWTRSPLKTLNPGVCFFCVPAASGGPSSPHFGIPRSTFSNPRPAGPRPRCKP
jgi:hypothetical protein